MSEQEKANASSETPAAKKQDDKPAKVKKPSVAARASKWVRDLKSETKKIVWPTKEQVTNNTLVVIAAILIVGVFIWVLDFVFKFGVDALIALAAR